MAENHLVPITPASGPFPALATAPSTKKGDKVVDVIGTDLVVYTANFSDLVPLDNYVVQIASVSVNCTALIIREG